MIRIGFIGTGNISRRHFTALAKLRDQELTCAAEGIHTQRVGLAANRSAETGQPVRPGRT